MGMNNVTQMHARGCPGPLQLLFGLREWVGEKLTLSTLLCRSQRYTSVLIRNFPARSPELSQPGSTLVRVHKDVRSRNVAK